MKNPFLFTLIFLFMFSTSVSAHTALEKSSPNEGEELHEDIDQIALEFNTKVEKTSTFKLMQDGDKEIAVEDIQITDNQMEGSLNTPLEDGSYTVIWKIIGADGHPIEGEFAFIVSKNNASNPETTPSNPDEVKPDTESQEIPEEPESTPSSNNLIYVAIIILFVTAVSSIILLMRKGRK